MQALGITALLFIALTIFTLQRCVCGGALLLL